MKVEALYVWKHWVEARVEAALQTRGGHWLFLRENGSFDGGLNSPPW